MQPLAGAARARGARRTARCARRLARQCPRRRSRCWATAARRGQRLRTPDARRPHAARSRCTRDRARDRPRAPPARAPARTADCSRRCIAATCAHAFELPEHPEHRRATSAGCGRVRAAGRHRRSTLRYAAAVARGTNLVRWLTALPPNVLDAARLPRAARARWRARIGLKLRWLRRGARCERARRRRIPRGRRGNARRDAGIAHLQLPAGARARRAPRRTWRWSARASCFDTGGTNLKPHRSMLDMHTDMSGSAVALGDPRGAGRAAARRIAVDAWLAITENRIGPTAYTPAGRGARRQRHDHPGDPHRRRRAHGAGRHAGARRAHASRAACIDFATLTGACVYALTERMSGVFTNRAALRDAARGRRHAQRRARLALPDAGGLRHGPREPGGRRRAVRGRRQGRPHPRGALPAALRAAGHPLGARRPVVRHAHAAAWRTCRTEITGFGVRFALRSAAASRTLLAARLAPVTTPDASRRPDDWHLHLRDGAALAAVLPHTAARFARAIVMPNLQAAGDHDRAGARLPRAHPRRAARRQRASSR